MRGLFLERDRHGRSDERQAERVETGDERRQLGCRARAARTARRARPARGPRNSRCGAPAKASATRGRRGGRRARRTRRGRPTRVHVGEIAGRNLPGRRRASRVERAERESRAEVRREDARRDPGLPHPESGEPPVAVGGLQLEKAQDVRRRRSPSRRASRSARRKRASAKRQCPKSAGTPSVSWREEIFLEGGMAAKRFPLSRRNSTSAKSKPAARAPSRRFFSSSSRPSKRRLPPASERTVAMRVLPANAACSAPNSGAFPHRVEAQLPPPSPPGGSRRPARPRTPRRWTPGRRRRREASFRRSGPKRKTPPVRRGWCRP